MKLNNVNYEMISKQFYDTMTDIPTDFGEVNKSASELAYQIYITKKHNKDINRKIKADLSDEFYTIISYGFLKEEIVNASSLISIKINIAFSWKDSKTGGYYHTMKEGIKLTYCPQYYREVFLCYWDPQTGKYLDKHKNHINIFKLIEELYSQSLLPTRPIRGVFIRIKRIIQWYILYPLLRIIFNFSKTSYNCLTGKQISIDTKKQPFMSLNFVLVDNKLDLVTIEEGETKKIDFFGISVNLKPLTTYSAIHMFIYLVLAWTNYFPKFIARIFKNPFLTVIYVILSLALMEFVVGKLFYIVCKKVINIQKKIKFQMVPQFEKQGI